MCDLCTRELSKLPTRLCSVHVRTLTDAPASSPALRFPGCSWGSPVHWRAGAFYMRLVGKPLEVYQYLEPLYNDYRKVGTGERDGRDSGWCGESTGADRAVTGGGRRLVGVI